MMLLDSLFPKDNRVALRKNHVIMSDFIVFSEEFPLKELFMLPFNH